MAIQIHDTAIQKRLVVGVLMVLSLLLFLTAFGYLHSGQTASKPRIGLMTTLPLRWAEGDMAKAIELSVKPSGAYNRLAAHYKIDLVDTPAQLGSQKVYVLVLAQPRALSPVELVQLDMWVRGGGKLLIFADPALAWESDYSLGDKRRPLFTSLLSPLFMHWGVELVLPMDGGKTAEVRKISDYQVRMPTPGAWQLLHTKGDANCNIMPDYLVADCTIGKGRALLVADADILDASQWQGTGARAFLGSDDFANMDWVVSQIEALRGKGIAGEIMGKIR